ncbi:hypothetical protein MUP77_15160 [Candidatus Bathyarchaeota archaeon]|nr:hypothetical protein [Candidatus Bathyarchaeota archaeon]
MIDQSNLVKNQYSFALLLEGNPPDYESLKRIIAREGKLRIVYRKMSLNRLLFSEERPTTYDNDEGVSFGTTA